MQHYVIKFVSDLRQVSVFLWALRFPPPIKLTATKKRNMVEMEVKNHNPQCLDSKEFDFYNSVCMKYTKLI